MQHSFLMYVLLCATRIGILEPHHKKLIVFIEMQTLSCLHEDAGYAHLDVTSVNVMWNPCADNAWDSLRVLDFGFSMQCVSGTFGFLSCLSLLPFFCMVSLCLTLCSGVTVASFVFTNLPRYD